MAGETAGQETALWNKTPLQYSKGISARLGCLAYLKLENLQPSQSFKNRGIALFIHRALLAHGPSAHFVIASSGSAGMAAAHTAHRLGVRCTVCLPLGAMPVVLQGLRGVGAEVFEEGNVYSEALQRAEAIAHADPNGIMVPAYDDPTIWEGHGSMVQEIAAAPEFADGKKPAAIFCCVGGGGLIGGIMDGCKKAGWDDVHIVAIETHGASAFYQSVALNKGWKEMPDLHQHESWSYDKGSGVRLVRSTPISRATSLGSTSPAPKVVKETLGWKGGVSYITVPDGMGMETAVQFADNEGMLIELASSTTLVPAYYPNAFEGRIPVFGWGDKAVFIICGGLKISLEEIEKYRSLAEREGAWDIVCNGERWVVSRSSGK